jgi:ubiquinone/menaquinone biosynthesis C-methylase UbiE
VSDVRELLACPACRGELSANWSCVGCGARFDAADGIPNLRLRGDSRTETVRAFYDVAPFPGYPARDNLSTFHHRAERSRFAQLLDRAIPGDARIAEVGCGTGQMSLYLARADRIVIAADLSRSSLLLGVGAARRFGIGRVHFIETDLHQPALKSEAFDVVYSSGVLHHTPKPLAAFAHIARLARRGGIVIVGVYNAVARFPLRVRRTVARATQFRVVPFDPVLRERHHEPARRTAWLRDQYQHPEEHSHTVGEIKRWFVENDVEYLRSFPSTVLDDDSQDLFASAIDDWTIERWIAQLGWMWTLSGEGGLFVAIGRRR